MAILRRLPVDECQLDTFCQRWKIIKLELFGSTLADPARARDVDLLVTFAQDARWGLFEHEHMQNELAGLFGRSVDLISRRAIETSRNALRRNAILSSACPFMSPNERSGTATLSDLVAACLRVMGYVQGASRSDLDQDDRLLSACC